MVTRRSAPRALATCSTAAKTSGSHAKRSAPRPPRCGDRRSPPRARQARLDGRSAHTGSVGIGSLHHVIGGGEIPPPSGEGAHVVEADTEEGRPGAGKPAICRLEPEDSTERGGTRMEPLVSEPSARGTKPAATAAPDPPEEPRLPRRIVGIARGSVVRFSVVNPKRVLVHVERAQEHGTCAAQFLPPPWRRGLPEDARR